MPPSNSVGHGSVNDDNSQADQAVDDSCSNTLMTKAVMTPDGKCVNHPWVELRGKDIASGQVYQRDSCPECNEQYEANKEALMQRKLELDRQLQALENENNEATSRSGGSVDLDVGPSPSFASTERTNNLLSTSSEAQPYRPPLAPPQSPGRPAPMPVTDESVGHSYPQRQQAPRHQLPSPANGVAMYAQHGPTRISSSASVGSGSTSSNHRPAVDSFNNGSSVKTFGSASYPYSNAYDPQFLAAAAAAFHQQQQFQQATIASVNSGISQQQVQKEGNEDNNTSLLWKLLHDKEDELKEVRQTLRETQQKFQEQSLLATKLQTTLDQVQAAFEKERLLIKLQAEKEAQESLSFRQEELFQKQLKWMENNIINKNVSPATVDGNDKFVANDPTNTDLSTTTSTNKANQQIDVVATNNGAAAAMKSPSNTNVSPEKERVLKNTISTDGDGRDGYEGSQNNASGENKNMFKIPPNSNNKTSLYPSIDETLNGNANDEHKNAVQTNVASTAPVETPISNKVSNVKNQMNESTSSDRFDPVYVAQSADKDEDMAKEATYNFPNDDDKSLGQTVASSTYGDDRVKVVNKKLLDPYGDKGTYTGVVLRNTGMPHGLGRMVYEEDRRVFEGDWRHGRWHGYGRASFSNGDSYEGEYKFDQRHGTGVYRWNDGRVYDGQFSEDKRHGKGIFTWPDGAVYDGDFVNGQRQGHGKYTFADGGQYEGSWKDGRYDGFGTCTWEDGRRYRGEWRNGMAHGRGTETYPNGNIRHEGEWIDDEPIR